MVTETKMTRREVFGTLAAVLFPMIYRKAFAAGNEGDPHFSEQGTRDSLKQVDQNTHSVESSLDQLAANRFAEFAAVLGISEEQSQSPRIGNHTTFIVALTDYWLFCGDISGNQTFRPIANTPHVAEGIKIPVDPYQRVITPEQCELYTRRIASFLGYQTDTLTKSISKREFLLFCECGNSVVESYGARFLTRILTDDGDRHFQLICDCQGNPIRIDTNLPHSTAQELSGGLFAQIKGEGSSVDLGEPLHDVDDPMVFGTFFLPKNPNDPSKWRFEANARSFHGRDFLKIEEESNPYPKREEYGDEFWSFQWWERYGRVGGARGNCDPMGQWQKPNVSLFHKDLSDYDLEEHTPATAGNHLKQPFFDDLETCTAASFSTHGGPIDDQYQMDMGKGWCLPIRKGYGFGMGNLRHLFLSTCGALGCFKEGSLYRDERFPIILNWLSGEMVGGLRTVCGFDGEFTGLDRDGWRFFGHYNKGDSICDAWTNGMLDECTENAPVTVAYGPSVEEALRISLDGRFSTTASQARISVASVWKDII